MPTKSFYNDSYYKSTQAEITRDAWRRGVYDLLRIPNQVRICINNSCGKNFQVKPHDKKVYCSSRCAAIVNNAKRPKKEYLCATCSHQLPSSERKYCSLKCQANHYYNQYISRWKQGLEDGRIGITTHLVSHYLKRYIWEKFQAKCSICGWNKKHPLTGKPPLEIDHIDGNAENNKEENLRLICPNCHSLTSSFRNLNKGKGRAWRLTYLKNHT